MSKTTLTPKQQQFCNEYLIDLNGTRAYKAVYKSCKKDETANVNSSRTLRIAKVQAYIASKQQEMQQRTKITQDMVLKELASVAFANGSDFAKVVEKAYLNETTGKEEKYALVDITPTEQLDKDKLPAIASIKQGKNGIEIKTADKMKALELLGKHLGMFKDKEDTSAQLNKLDDILSKIGGNI